MPFQNGDGRVHVDGQDYILRLTIGGLADISHRLSVSGPQALTAHLTHLKTKDARVILSCLLVNPPPSEVLDCVSDAEIINVLPVMCGVFEAAFV